MEQAINKNIEVSFKTNELGNTIFEISNIASLNNRINTDINEEFLFTKFNSKIIYPERKLIELNNHIIDSTTII